MLWTNAQTGPGGRFMWELQYDQFYYAANARALAHDGAGIFHANAYDDRPSAPKIYSHLYPLILAGAASLFRLEPIYAALILRPIFGVLLSLSIWYFLAPFFPERRWRTAVFLCLLLSGGISGLSAAAEAAGAALASFDSALFFKILAERFYANEGTARDWLCSLARNYSLVPETLYHAIWFAAVGAYLNGRRILSTGLVALELYAHPFTGPELAAVMAAACAAEIILDRTRPRPAILQFAAVIGLLAMFALYARRLDLDVGQHLLRLQWAKFKSTISLTSYPMIYGVWLPLGLAACLRLGKRLASDARLRVILIQAAVVFVLSHHQLILPKEFQPAHFSRGYLFAALVVLSFMFIRHLKHTHPAGRLGQSLEFFSRPRVFAALLIALSIDSGLYYLYVAVRAPDPPQVISADRAEVIDRLSKEPSRQFVAADADIGYLLPVFSPHRVLIGHFATTPEFALKSRLWESWLVFGDTTLFKKFPDLSVLVIPRELPDRLPIRPDGSDRWSLMFENGSFSVWRRPL